MKKTIIKIKTINQLKKAIQDGKHDYFILLNGGLKSSKYIEYNSKKKKFNVFNEIDGTSQLLTEKQLMTHSWTNIGKAMKLGALICKN